MKIHDSTKKGSKERKVVIGMITSKVVLGRLAAKWRPKSFASKWANIIGQWCVDYYTKYHKAPNSSVEGLFERWAEKNKDEDTIRSIEKFLSGLSTEYKRIRKQLNSEYLIDLAGDYFNEVAGDNFIKDLQSYRDTGQMDKFHQKVATFSKVEMGVGAGVDLFIDKEEVISTFAPENRQTLLKLPGALGHFFSDSLARGKFIAFMGPDKVGKSYWLQEMAFQSMLQRRRVAFFAVGDMTKAEMKERIIERAARHPSYSPSSKWPYKVEYPVKITRSEDGETSVDCKTMRFAEPVDGAVGWKACREIMREQVRSKRSYFRLSCHPNFSVNVPALVDILKTWEVGGFLPDVVIIDYADLLTPPISGYYVESRDQIDVTWRQLRGLSQTKNNLVITATQSDATAYVKANTKKMLDRSNFSNDKRKLAHVSGMVGLNQSDMQKKFGITLLNWIVKRRGAYTSSNGVYVAGCLAVANPAVVSCF